MTKTIGRIAREGVIHFGDGSISVWEEGIPNTSHAARDSWEKRFKREVFARFVQTLHRVGWTVTMPEIKAHDVKHYGGNVARWAAERRRECAKGGLAGELTVNGRVVEFKMWQTVLPSDNPNGPRYDFDKEARMPYLLRLEMERTRRRIRDYLLGVFTGYTFAPPRDPEMGLMGMTALEKARHNRMTSGHYRPELDRAEISMPSSAIAADGGTIEHGARVWALDHKGRIITGTAFYSLNGNWQIVTGKYGLTTCHTGRIFTQQPEALRVKRNSRERRGRLERELAKATKAMDFERAAILRDILFPRDAKLYVIRHYEGDCWWAPNSCGYRNDMAEAGRYTEEEVKRVLGPGLKSSRGDHAIAIT